MIYLDCTVLIKPRYHKDLCESSQSVHILLRKQTAGVRRGQQNTECVSLVKVYPKGVFLNMRVSLISPTATGGAPRTCSTPLIVQVRALRHVTIKKKNAKCKLKDNAFTCFDVQMHICNSNFTKNQI